MKSAEECQSIEEIRECIDAIDKSIITNLALRASYVKCASQFKKSISDVKAEDRVKAMILTRRDWAKESSINPDFIESIFHQIVSFFVKGEIDHWQKSNG